MLLGKTHYHGEYNPILLSERISAMVFSIPLYKFPLDQRV